MKNQKIGYVDVVFSEEIKQEISRWVKSLKKEDFYTTMIDGQVEGGDVSEKLHLTLFYGFDESLVEKDKIIEHINSIKLESVEVDKVGFFPLDKYNCKILFLKIKDNNNLLKKIHNDLGLFPNVLKYQESEYVPHITIAYVKKDFNMDAISYNGPKILDVKSILYHSK